MTVASKRRIAKVERVFLRQQGDLMNPTFETTLSILTALGKPDEEERLRRFPSELVEFYRGLGLGNGDKSGAVNNNQSGGLHHV